MKPRCITPRIHWPALWKKFEKYVNDDASYEWEKQQKKIMALVEEQVAKLLKGGKTPLCFSCEKKPQRYTDGLCEACHRVAVAESKRKGKPRSVWVVEGADEHGQGWTPLIHLITQGSYAVTAYERSRDAISMRNNYAKAITMNRYRVSKYVRSDR